MVKLLIEPSELPNCPVCGLALELYGEEERPIRSLIDIEIFAVSKGINECCINRKYIIVATGENRQGIIYAEQA